MRQRSAADPVFEASATPLLVRFADVDMMQVVHHAAYVHWFEQIRFMYLKNILEVTTSELRSACIAFPVVKCCLEYHKAVTFDEPLVGYGSVELHRNSTFSFHYQIRSNRGGEHLCTTGTTLHCYVTDDLRLLLCTPPLMRDSFARARRKYPDGLSGYEPGLAIVQDSDHG
jgi:acyl-CoA thioester hydrolase